MSSLSNPILDDNDPALFPKLTDSQLELLARSGKPRTIHPGDVLFREGDATYDPMALLEGTVAVVIGSGDEQRDLAIQKPRDLMVEFNILTGERVGATGVVREGGSILVIPANEFRALLGRELVFGDFVLQMLFRRRKAIEQLQIGIRIVGSRFDPDTHPLREFASRNRLIHDWVDADEPRGESLRKSFGIEDPRGPIILLRDGKWLLNPSNSELAAAMGLHISNPPAEKSYDLVIVGAGPGGLAAAVYGASSGLRTAILEAEAVGGQAATSARIENYLGFPAGLSGADLAERARLQAAKFGARFLAPCRAIGLTERAGYHAVTLDSGDELLAGSVILALGVQYRRLPVPRLAEFEGLGVAYAVDSAREQLRKDDAVIVVGGANSAGQAALAFAEDGRTVYIVARADTLDRSMARYLRDRIAARGIEVLLGHEVRQLAGNGHLEQVVVEKAATGERRTIAAGALVVFIGAAPDTDWLAAAITLDSDGFVLTGSALPSDVKAREPWLSLGRDPLMLETSRPGVFAIGDVRSGSTKMVAAAVGEGGMAVRFVAEHLSRTPHPAIHP